MTTQLETLRQFPLTIQWRDVWEATTQYIKNDAVISPTDRSVYVLIVTSELGGDDPAINTNWFPITSSTTGVTDIIAIDGVENVGTGTNAILDNTGVLTVRPGANISITGTANNPVINGTLTIPRLCLLFEETSAVISNFPVTTSTAGQITYGTSLSALFNDYMTNGAPDANGTFYIDLTSLNFFAATIITAPSQTISIIVVDTTLNLSITIGLQKFNNAFTFTNPQSLSLGTVGLNVATVRTAGLREVNAFRFGLLNPVSPASLNLTASGNISAVYSPTG